MRFWPLFLASLAVLPCVSGRFSLRLWPFSLASLAVFLALLAVFLAFLAVSPCVSGRFPCASGRSPCVSDRFPRVSCGVQFLVWFLGVTVFFDGYCVCSCVCGVQFLVWFLGETAFFDGYCVCQSVSDTISRFDAAGRPVSRVETRVRLNIIPVNRKKGKGDVFSP